MVKRQTEHRHQKAQGLDARPLEEVAQILLTGQADALRAVSAATDAIARGGQVMADAVRAGRQLVYAAAGSSGLMAMADACELAGTFGLDPQSTRILMAGGVPTDASMPGGTEDDCAEATAAAEVIGKGDAVICLSASGSTPYTVTLARIAKARGARTICIANNPDTPLLSGADVAICLPTPAEVVAGSTRMGAGTAQKVALNMMSTVMGVSLGHIHDGMMVNLHADNAKLRDRAVRMVSHISGVSDATARQALESCGGRVKPAAICAAGASNSEQAEALLAAADGQLRAALTALRSRA